MFDFFDRAHRVDDGEGEIVLQLLNRLVVLEEDLIATTRHRLVDVGVAHRQQRAHARLANLFDSHLSPNEVEID